MAANPEDFIDPQDEGEEEFEPDFDGLLAAIDAYEATAYGSDTDGGELSNQRALSLDAFAGKNIEPQPEGRSQVVDWTVFETIQWMLPSLCRIFTGDDNIVEFEPFGEEDEQAAEQESQFLDHLVTQKNNWFLICLTWFQDALLTKNAYCMASIDEITRTEVETYERQSEEQVALLVDDTVEVVGQQAYPDPDHKPEPVIDETGEITGTPGQPVVDPFTGQPVMTEPDMLFDLQIRQTEARKKLTLKVLPPERCLVDENCTDFTLAECDYFEYWDNVTISSLRQMGYDVEDDVGDDADHDTLEDSARDSILKASNARNARRTPDPSTRIVKARWIWAKHDYDGDGIAELIHVLRVGNEVYELDYAHRIPVSSLVPFLNTHRHIGTSVSDLVFDIQRIKTAILRQGLDNLYYANNPQKIHSNAVDLDDLHVVKPGGSIGIDTDQPDVAGHLMFHTPPFVFPQAQEGLRHMDTVTESRVGVNRMFQGIDESNLNHYDRIGKLTTMAAQRIEQIARIFGNGVENLFSICHELIIKSGHQAESIKLRGEWVDFDPKQWKTGRDMRVVAPYAAGNKDSLLERLMVISSVMKDIVAAGGPMVQADNIYNMGLEMAKAADLPGNKFFTDPATIPPPEPQPDPTMIALEIEASKDETKRLENEQDAQDAEANRQTDIQKAQIAAETDLAVALIRAGGSIDLEQLKQRMTSEPIELNTEATAMAGQAIAQFGEVSSRQIEALNRAIERLEKAQNSSKRLIRDDEGNIVGVEPVQEMQ